MARKKRYDIVPLHGTTTLHIINRMVQRLPLLAAVDTDSKNLAAKKALRRQDLTDRLIFLSTIFPVQIFAHAFMSNHYHLVLRWQPQLVDHWSDTQICKKWWAIHPVQNVDENTWMANKLDDQAWLAQTRIKFRQIGQFMKDFKQNLAQKWNLQSDASGNVFNRHYDALPIQGTHHLATAMAYVDLNGFAAGTVDLPEQAPYHSLSMRLNHAPRPLTDYNEGAIPWENLAKILPDLKLTGYLQFVDCFARKIREGKKHLTDEVQPILQRLQTSVPTDGQSANFFNTLIDTAKCYVRSLHDRYMDGKRIRLACPPADPQSHPPPLAS